MRLRYAAAESKIRATFRRKTSRVNGWTLVGADERKLADGAEGHADREDCLMAIARVKARHGARLVDLMRKT